jgi:acyl-coenzyme A synthetase/AMP-(fatty) acid ligase
VVKKDPALKAQEVVDFIAGKVAPYKKLRGGVVFTDSIPKSPSGKILRRELKDVALKEPKARL